jgi:hypothetical protein
MPAAGKSDVVIDKTTIASTGFVTVTTGDATHTFIDIQNLYDAAREWEAEVENLDVEALVVGSGKEGIGGGNFKPPTIVIQSIAEVVATTRGTLEIFRYEGGTLLSDEEAADAADPRSPLKPVANVEYDRTKGQEGVLFITEQSGLTAAESAALINIDTNVTSMQTDVTSLLAAQDLTNEQKEAEHTTSRATGTLILRNTTALRRWEALAWEDEAQTIPYGTNSNAGIESVGMLVEVAWS